MTSKQQVMDEISRRVGIRHYFCSTGSTEPKEFFVDLAVQLGLQDLIVGKTKPEIAEIICLSLGQPWHLDYDSTGSTVTKQGLMAILRGLDFLG